MTGAPGGVRLVECAPAARPRRPGLRGDDIITRIGSEETPDLQAMTDALRSHQPGETVDIVVRRGAGVPPSGPRSAPGEAEMPVLDSDRVVAALRGAFAREEGREELLRTAAEKIRAAGAALHLGLPLHAARRELVLEAFAGRETDHTRIPVGVGVCGTAVASGQDQNVPDVRAVENYLACNAWTRSELVVLIRRGDLILGQIDIDSDVPDPFTPEEEAAVKQVADALAVLL